MNGKNNPKIQIALFFLFSLFSNLLYSQIIQKTLIKERDFLVEYYTNDDYVIFKIETNATPFIFTDINRNKRRDGFIDRMYTVNSNKSMCVTIFLDNFEYATTTCDQPTNSKLIVNGNIYQFIIPKNELSYEPMENICVSFKTYDKEGKSKFYTNPRDNSENFIINR